jgi:hypothetical protein
MAEKVSAFLLYNLRRGKKLNDVGGLICNVSLSFGALVGWLACKVGEPGRKRTQEFQKYFNYILQNGTEQQKQTTSLMYQTKQLDPIRALVGFDILTDL